MKILVFSEENIQRFKTKERYAVISVQDPRCDFVRLYQNPNRRGVLQLKFYDLDTPTGQENYDSYMFTVEDARKILTFVECLKDSITILCVNCVAGVSRSAGIAGAISKIYNGTDEYFFKHYLPNSLVYRTILDTYYKDKI